MKEITRYVCETCGTEYTNRADAEECERRQPRPLRIARASYLPIEADESGYPIEISVEMSNDLNVIYKRI